VFVSAQWNGPWSEDNGVFTFTTNNLPSGASATATILVNAPTEGVFTSAANVGSGVLDLVSANNSANTTLTVTENPSMPTLQITPSANNVILSWSTNAVNFVVQSKTNLSDSAWINATNSPTKVGSRWMVTNSVSGPGNLYRLRK